jgi:peptidyl-prolyl cis-trans isomerase C
LFVKRLAFFGLAILLLAGCQRSAPEGDKAPAGTARAASPQKADPQKANPPSQTMPPPGQSASTPPGATPAVPPSAQPPAKPVPAQLPVVLARVNGETIERAAFERALRNLEANARRKVPASERDAIYRSMLDEMVALKLLEQEATKRGLSVSAAELDAKVKEARQRFDSEQAFTKALASRGMTLVQLKNDAKQQLLVDRLLRAEVEPKVNVTDAEVKEFYDKNPERFKRPESVRASHILIRVDANADAAAKQAARARADELLKQLRAGGDFAALAKQHSQDGSAANGGDLGVFGRGQMVKPFDDAVFALKPGEMSGVVESPFGFHIIKSVERQPASTVPLAEVSDKVGAFLKQNKFQALSVELARALRAKSNVEILI